MSLRIVFAGTPEFAALHLQALLDAGHSVVAVYTQPDRPAGRGQKLQPSPVKALALEHGLPVRQPASLKAPEAQAELAAFAPDLMIVVAYGLLLPQAVLDIPRLGCVNVHGSLLPRWRGAAPIQRAVLAGDAESGVGIMRMEAGLDTGPVLLEKRLSLAADETGGSLHDRLAALGCEALVEALPGIADGSLKASPQPEAGVSYAHKLAKEEARLDWRKTAAELERQVRAFNPWPVAETALGGDKLRIWQAAAETGSGQPGGILSADRNGILVACGSGALRLEQLQLPGGKPLSAQEILNGRGERFAPGQRLGETE
ncbi:MAG: methionyl-tRNA formyltransferase [Gammaproteobacteria bacterium]|nr:methionyl-tRNA formyltransferase [Gammaproteobacteria bacterium]